MLAYAFSSCRILVGSADTGATSGGTGFGGVRLAATVVDSVFGGGPGEADGVAGVTFVSLPVATARPGWLGVVLQAVDWLPEADLAGQRLLEWHYRCQGIPTGSRRNRDLRRASLTASRFGLRTGGGCPGRLAPVLLDCPEDFP